MPLERSAQPCIWYSCSTYSCPSGSQRCRGTWRRSATVALDPDVDPSRPAHGDGRVVVEFVPTQGSSGSLSGPDAPCSAARERAVGEERHRPGAETRADVLHAVFRSVLHALSEGRQLVGPAEEDEAGDQRGAGHVVEQQVQWGSGPDLVGQFLSDRFTEVATGS